MHEPVNAYSAVVIRARTTSASEVQWDGLDGSVCIHVVHTYSDNFLSEYVHCELAFGFDSQ